jgi:outer membrane protein assembly factor BamB
MKTLATLLILFSNLILLGQNRMPYINQILELEWHVELESKGCLPIIVDGIIIPGYGLNYAVDALTGEKIEYGTDDIKRISDSLICFNTKKTISLMNIYSNEKVFEKEKKSFRPAQRHPYFQYNNQLVYVDQPKRIVCKNIVNGDLQWDLITDNSFYDELLIYKNSLIVADKKSLYEILLNTGDVEWKESFVKINSNFHLEDNVLFFGTAEQLIAFNIDSKQIIWEYKTNSFRSKIIIENDKLYYHNDIDLFCLNKNTGDLIWKTNRGEETCNAIYFALAGNYLLTSVQGYDRTPIIAAFDKKTGKEIYSFWKSDTFDFLKDTSNINYDETSSGVGIEFYPYVYKNFLFGITKKYMLAFQIKTPADNK